MKKFHVRTISELTYDFPARYVYQEFRNIDAFHRFVPYYKKNRIIWRGKNWLLKEMTIESDKSIYRTKSLVVFAPTSLSYHVVQLEGKFPGMTWDLKVLPINSHRSKAISTHLIQYKNVPINRGFKLDTLKKKLKTIEKQLLVSMKKRLKEV